MDDKRYRLYKKIRTKPTINGNTWTCEMDADFRRKERFHVYQDPPLETRGYSGLSGLKELVTDINFFFVDHYLWHSSPAQVQRRASAGQNQVLYRLHRDINSGQYSMKIGYLDDEKGGWKYEQKICVWRTSMIAREILKRVI